jgi:hypothetical protein
MTKLDGEGWGIADAAALVAEIDRDLADREAHYPDQARKGRIAQEEADYLVGLIGDIRADLLFAFAPLAPGELRGSYERPNPRVTWSAKVKWINGELEHRCKRLPDLVAKGRLTQADADRRIGAIEQLRRLYWNKLFQWQPPEGPAIEYLRALRSAVDARADTSALRSSEGAKIYRELVRRHMAAVEQESGQAQGELVA